MSVNYSTVTEVPGDKVSQEQLARMYNRYCFAASFCEGKDVLEVACGAGQGLGYLAKKARYIVGGDYTNTLVQSAKDYYKESLEICQLDGHRLPFGDKSFDVVILYEAIYYLADTEKFVAEAYRVLKEDGILIICTVNRDWDDFNPSPFSQKYFSAPELFNLLKQKFSDVELYGAFTISTNSVKEKMISLIKRMAVALHLIPKTMKGKEIFKRFFFGNLLSLPQEIEENMCDYTPPVIISNDASNSQYKVLYAVARIG